MEHRPFIKFQADHNILRKISKFCLLVQVKFAVSLCWLPMAQFNTLNMLQVRMPSDKHERPILRLNHRLPQKGKQVKLRPNEYVLVCTLVAALCSFTNSGKKELEEPIRQR